MKILFFINNLAGGGAERVTATLANFWARQRWEVTVVTLAPEAEDFYLLDPRVCRIALDLSGPSRGALDAVRQNLRRIAALRRVLDQLRPTFAIAIMSAPSVLLALASRGRTGLHTIGSEHCFPPHFPLGLAWSLLRRQTYGRLSAVVALTDECATWIRSHSQALQVPVIPNAVAWPLADDPLDLAPGPLCHTGHKLLLAVGRLDPVKDFDLLVRVFAGLAGKHPDWSLVILGEGPERAALAAAIARFALDGRILLPGLVTNLGAWYARADLFALTSRSEGFPNALAEALAHGVPAVSLDCDTGPRDIVRHGIDGLLVMPDDGAGLAAALDRLMGDGALRQRLAARAPEARNRFSVARVASMWESLFVALSGGQAPPVPGDLAPLARHRQ